ncbi:MAG: glycosyltransferase family 9 protein [bacterium]|nr:glycosyltransferase family 9 protein [bacterium]
MENSPTRVLIIDTAWLGDVLFTTSLIGAVREAWPQTEIHLVTAPRARELVLHHPELASIRIFDKHGNEGGYSALRKLASELNAIKFDVVLCAHPSMRSRLLCSMLDAPVRVGHQGLLASWAFTIIVHNDLAVEPDHVERRLNLLRAVVPVRHIPPLRVGVSPDEKLWSERLFSDCGANPATTLALIPGSARKTKQWDPADFVKLTRLWLQSHSSGRVFVFLGPNEALLKPVFEAMSEERIIIVEESLRKCAALLSNCVVGVGNDTWRVVLSDCRRL